VTPSSEPNNRNFLGPYWLLFPKVIFILSINGNGNLKWKYSPELIEDPSYTVVIFSDALLVPPTYPPAEL
jgi:hypothetical protein